MTYRLHPTRWLAAGITTACCLASSTSLASGFHNEDFGVRRMGMFSVVARPDDGTAVFHNPAGMTLFEGTRFYSSLSVFYLDLGLRLYDSQGQLRPEHELGPDWNIGILPFVGIASDLGTDDLRLGLAVYAPNAYGAAMPDDEPTRYHVTKALFISSRATVTGAYEVNDRFSIGANISVVHNYLTMSRYMNAAVFQDPDRRFDPPSQTSPLDAKLDISGQHVTYAWDVGFLLSPTDDLKLGAAFFSGSDVNLRGDARLEYANGTIEETKHTTTLKIPFTIRAGLNYELTEDFEVGADIRYYHYQVFQEQRTDLDEPIMGIDALVDPKNYTNAWNWSIGILYHVTDTVEFMSGYQEDYTPIPTRTFSLDNPSRDQKGVGLGLRWQATEGSRFGIAFVRNWFDLVDVQDNIANPPANAKGYGSNTELGLDYTLQL